MRNSLLFLSVLLASCSRAPYDGFAVVDPWGSVVMLTPDEGEARRLSEKLTMMGRVFPSKPQYFVVRGSLSGSCRTLRASETEPSPP